MPNFSKKGKTLCKIIMIALLASISQTKKVLAQEEFSLPNAKMLTRFSYIQLTGGVVVLRANIDNYADTLNFIFDTGSGGISLDSATVNRLQIANSPSNKTIRGIAGIRTVNFAYNHTLKLPGLVVDSLNFHINDYESISSVYGIKIDGIVGFSFLKRYIVKLDYDKEMMEVYSKGFYKYPRKGFLLRPNIAGIPVQEASLIENHSLQHRFFFDTGAGLCVLLSSEFCEDNKVFSSKKRKYETITEGMGGRKSMHILVLNTFQIGPYKFKKLPVYIFDDEFNVTSYPNLAGLIGNDLLRRFNVIMNYAQNEIHLQPNNHFKDPFDYSYTGLALYTDGIGIYISDVISGSPADKAGLKPEDEILGIEQNFTKNMQEYKNILLGNIGKVDLTIRRNDKIFTTKMKIASVK